MSIAEITAPDASPVPSLPPGTTPAEIRDALIDEERIDFERAYHEALIEADRTMDLTNVLSVLRSYHRIAWMTQKQGVEAHRRMMAQVKHAMATGETPPGSVPWEELRAQLGL